MHTSLSYAALTIGQKKVVAALAVIDFIAIGFAIRAVLRFFGAVA